jgi:transcriptional regulator with XRE-family HTH domain
MAQSTALVDTLKGALKSHGFTYADVARSLKLSEARVKRLFADSQFSLERLDAICKMMQMEITDLVYLFDSQQKRITHLTEVQEQEVVSDLRLLLVAVLVRSHWTFEEIVEHYQINETECVQHLAKLDRLGLIELLPNNRAKLRVAEDFRWLSDGPIERFFRATVEQEFLQSSFTKPNQKRFYLTGTLGRSSHDVLMRKLDELAREFGLLHRQDTGLPIEERVNVGMVLAMRPFELSGFRDLQRS